ncbi:SRPBCC family protein [Mucilaginibacter sp. McL0603]|uniref:SRPBCC family protein n=1 Tax=Mucilaginibacter sp. McL0603 TaxID=3415670 RepID=UPI003CE74178
MDKPNYHVRLKVNTTTEQAIKAISNVSGWWAQEVDGNAKKQGDQFTVHFGKTWGQFRVSELSRNRIVWAVTDCYLDLLKDTKEWNETRLIFQFNSADDKTVIDVTHEGLTPDKECFNDCTKGWNFYFRESLFGYLEKEQGLPGAGIHAWLESDGKIYRGKIYTRDQLSTEMTGDLLLLDVKQTKVEQVLSAYSVSPFNGEAGKPHGDYYMLLNNEPGLMDHLQDFVNQTSMN